MKRSKIFFIFINVVLLTSISIQSSFSQIVGGEGDHSPSPKEVKATSLNSDAFKGDVSLTNGTLNLTQNLGKVSTPSGLSFSVDLNYSSTAQGGDNVPVINGVPYGEGWNISIPQVSVSTKFYTKLDDTSKELINTTGFPYPTIGQEDSYPPHFTQDDVYNENQPYWLYPQISIPGIINERFVFKYKEASSSSLVFMPAKFDRFIEARYDGDRWIVSLWDGTDYYFDVIQKNSVSPSNQRVYKDINGNFIDGVLNASPSEEILAYYCSKIKNSNHPSNQSIVFKYNKYGKFNFFKEQLNSSNSSVADASVYKDILLKEVAAIDNESVLEEVFLDYSTVVDGSTVINPNQNQSYVIISPNKDLLMNLNGVQDLLSINNTGVGRFDSLYNFKSIYKQGKINNVDFDFTNWLRYPHLKHDWLHNDCSANGASLTYMNSSNPYVGGFTPTCSILYHYPAELNPSNNSTNNSLLSFNHCFLESPELTTSLLGESMPAGDIYEIKTTEWDNNAAAISNNHARSINFDINISCGYTPDSYVICDPNGSGCHSGDLSYSNETLFNSLHKDKAFSTFGNALKWNFTTPFYRQNNTLETSNYFVMPNFPKDYNGLTIQIGPANSDNNYGAESSFPLNFNNIWGIPCNPPATLFTYYNEMEYQWGKWSSKYQLRGEGSIPQNFGMGLPWHMMKSFYDVNASACFSCGMNETDGQFQKWWNQYGITPAGWDNNPTLADQDVFLVNVELIRYCKNPYMLTSATYYKSNGNYVSQIDSHINENYEGNEPYISGMIPIKSYKLSYSVISGAPILDNVNVPETPPQLKGTSNIFILKRIIEVPVSALTTNTPFTLNLYPTTEFNYISFPDQNSVYPNVSVISNSNPPFTNNALAPFTTNAGMVAINEVINELGGITKYEYYPDLIGSLSYVAHISPNTSSPIDKERKAPGVSLSISAIVKYKKICDKNSTFKTWDYDIDFSSTNIKRENNSLDVVQEISGGPSDGHLLSGGKVNTSFCFREIKVKEPPIGPANGSPYSKFYNIYANQHLFGKLEKVEKYNANDDLIEKTEYEYKDELVYDEPIPSSSNDDYNLVIYDNCSFSPTFTLHDYKTDGTNLTMAKSVKFCEFEFREVFVGNNQKIFFIPKTKETRTVYGQNLTDAIMDIGPIENDATGIGYRTGIMARVVDDATLLDEEEGITQRIATTITEYAYYDGKFTVVGNNFVCKTTAEGFKRLLPGFTGVDYTLTYEPSFEIASKKTYSPQMPGEYSQEEFYYYYDLWNYFNNIEDATEHFNALKYSMIYGIRNMEYEHRIVTKRTGYNPVSKSKYYLYDTWKVPYYDSPEQEVFVDPTTNPGDVGIGQGWTDGGPCNALGNIYIGSIVKGLGREIEINTAYRENGNSDGNPCDGNYALRSHMFYYPLDTTYTVAARDLSWASCPLPYEIDRDSCLLLKSVIDQVDDGNLTAEYTGLASSKKTSANILRFEIDEVNGNDVKYIFPYEKLETFKSIEINRWGQQQKSSDAKGLITKYEYTPVSKILYKNENDHSVTLYYQVIRQHIGVPISVTVGLGLSEPLTTTYTYQNDYLTNTITDPNDLLTHFTYDQFGRLFEKFINNHKVSINTYGIWDRDDSDSFEERSAKNYSETKTFNNYNGNEGQVTREFIDPQGRQFNLVSFANSDILSNQEPDEIVFSGQTVIDKWGRIIQQYKPWVNNPENINNAPNNNLVPRLNQEFLAAPQDYKSFLYENDQRSRMLKNAPEGEDISTGHFKKLDYGYIDGNRLSYELGLNAYVHNMLFPVISEESMSYVATDFIFEKIRSTDEDGKMSITYNDMFGRKVALLQLISGEENTTATTIFLYDKYGNLGKVFNPEWQETNYYYNLIGNIYKKETVDGGTTTYMYDKGGNMVLEQDQVNSDVNFARISTFDAFGRKTKQEIRELTGNINNLSGLESNSWCFNRSGNIYNNLVSATSNLKLEKEWFYGEAINIYNVTYYNKMRHYIANSRTKMKGNLSHTISYNNIGKAVLYNFYSYNNEGGIKWEFQQFNPNGIFSNAKGLLTRIDYTDYNLKGSLLRKIVDVNCDHQLDFCYNQVYDSWTRLIEIYSGFNSTIEQNKKIVTYDYDEADGKLLNTSYYEPEYANQADNIGNNYDIRKRLTEMNSKFFHHHLYYDNTNLTVSSALFYSQNFNGNINSTYAHYKSELANADIVYNPMDANPFNNGSYYGYYYDGINRLTEAKWRAADGFSNGTYTLNPEIGNENYSFDRSGNLKSLMRWSLDYNLNEENFTYGYQYGANRLMDVLAQPDYPDRAYSYDANGNLLNDLFRHVLNIGYGRANLPYVLQMDNQDEQTTTPVYYLYNINDQRIYKEVYQGAANSLTEYYLIDASGASLGIVDLTANSWTWYVNGNQRVAKLTASDDQTPSEMTDDIGDWDDVDETDNRTAEIIAAFNEIENQSLIIGDTLIEIEVPGGDHHFYLASILQELPAFNFTIVSKQVIESEEQLMSVRRVGSNEKILITVGELIAEENLTSLDPAIVYSLLDPFYIPYTYYTNQSINNLTFYVYDHLGNTRVTYRPKWEAHITVPIVMYYLEGVFDYYPYGKILREYLGGPQEKYLTTQHERDVETGLDYRGARFYDADVARFLSLDPLAKEYVNISPYNYVAGNPVIFVDPNGKSFKPVNTNGKTAFESAFTQLFGKNYKSVLQMNENSGGVYSTPAFNKKDWKEILSKTGKKYSKEEKKSAEMLYRAASQEGKLYEVAGYVEHEKESSSKDPGGVEGGSSTNNKNMDDFDKSFSENPSQNTIDSKINSCEENGDNWGLVPFLPKEGEFIRQETQGGTILLDTHHQDGGTILIKATQEINPQ